MNYSDSLRYKRKITNWKATALITAAIFLAAAFIEKACAATYTITPDPIKTSAGFSAGPVNGIGTDTFIFRVEPNTGGSASLTNVSIEFGVTGGMNSMEAWIDDTYKLVQSVSSNFGYTTTLSSVFPSLSSTVDHKLIVNYNAVNASYGGNINISPVGAVPVPAAVWLFGSALAGLVGVGRRKQK